MRLFHCLFLIILFSGILFADADLDKKKKLKIKWHENDNAIGYEVQIADEYYKILIKREVEENSLEFNLPPGKYRIRIGIINVFHKIYQWTEWKSLKIEKKDVSEIKTSVFKSGIFFGGGFSYLYIFPDFNAFYNHSHNSAILSIGYNLRRINFLNAFFFYTGVELDSTFVKFRGKNIPQEKRIDVTNIIAGGNIYIANWFSPQIGLFIRSGGGLVYTQSEIFESQDPFYKIGCSLKYFIFNSFYIESGIDYYVLKYIGNDFTTIRYFCLFGVRL